MGVPGAEKGDGVDDGWLQGTRVVSARVRGERGPLVSEGKVPSSHPRAFLATKQFFLISQSLKVKKAVSLFLVGIN